MINENTKNEGDKSPQTLDVSVSHDAACSPPLVIRDGAEWVLSFGGSNPKPEECVVMTKEDAWKIHNLVMSIDPNLYERAKAISSCPTCSPRYSFRMPDGRLPMVGGKISWGGNRERAVIEAKSWGAVVIVVLHQNASGSWDIAEEIPLENEA